MESGIIRNKRESSRDPFGIHWFSLFQDSKVLHFFFFLCVTEDETAAVAADTLASTEAAVTAEAAAAGVEGAA